MQALDVLDNPLQWETERQNRIHQESIEHKKKQMRTKDTRKERHLADHIPQEKNRAFADTPRTLSNEAAMEEWSDKVRHIPEMRSAFIPLDEATEGVADWSKPFSLIKADMEPWLSFYKGYKESRLFLDAVSSRRNQAASGKAELQVDFAVRALLELKQLDTKIILEPPVQINGIVEYHDLNGELSVCRDQVLAKALAKVANDVHENHLRTAVERGRALGNLLYGALMGEGHINLIKAWEKAYKRKPTVEELHLMLTTGRVKISTERRSQALEVREKVYSEKAIPTAREIEPEKKQDSVAVKAAPQPLVVNAIAVTPEVTARSTIESTSSHNHKRAILLRLFHAVVFCAALIALGLII